MLSIVVNVVNVAKVGAVVKNTYGVTREKYFFIVKIEKVIKMNPINLNRKVNELPLDIQRELMVAHMVTLEGHLGATNPVFEGDLFDALSWRLADVYNGINRSPGNGRVTIESDL